MFTLAARLIGRENVDDAADAVQEAFIRAWLALPKFRRGARFSTWLYRICVNAAHDQRAKAQRSEPSDEIEIADPDDAFARQELSAELQHALNELEDDYRVAVVLYDVLGCSYAEIAEMTEVAEGTVKSRIFRGRSRLAERLGTTEELS
jgi:RNA polymerase sigma-70 factor (ECF subfamily)